MTNLIVKVNRTDNKVHFEGVSDANADISIPFDFAPPLGEGQGFAGLELLLMSFAGCVSTTIVFLLGRSGKHIASYSAVAEGIRTEHPLLLREIRLHISIESNDIKDTDMKNAVKQAEAVSPVWQAVKNNVTTNVAFELL